MPSTSASSDCVANVSPESSRIKSSAWPDVFTVPPFAYYAERKLDQGNAAFKTHSTFLSPDRKLKISILDGLGEEIVRYKVYPTNTEFSQVAEALIEKKGVLPMVTVERKQV
ncbi:MAG: hypothetical protein ACRC6N_07315 [Plesiomonas sp.]|uniref:hypothetical protein n=1 Tax=Plesiomonas sp. TaxID=2486279 RepID=UPI003F3D67E2